jgi:hypothetical protein
MYGSPTRDGEFGWQASLELLHPSLGFIGHWCGGVLINKYWVVSSAHCVHKWVRLKRKWERWKKWEFCGHQIKSASLSQRKGVKVNAWVLDIEVTGAQKMGGGVFGFEISTINILSQICSVWFLVFLNSNFKFQV